MRAGCSCTARGSRLSSGTKSLRNCGLTRQHVPTLIPAGGGADVQRALAQQMLGRLDERLHDIYTSSGTRLVARTAEYRSCGDRLLPVVLRVLSTIGSPQGDDATSRGTSRPEQRTNTTGA